jgi:hypothetical protein
MTADDTTSPSGTTADESASDDWARSVGVGAALGVGIAFAFALVCRLLPESLLTEPTGTFVFFVAMGVTAPLNVVIAGRVAAATRSRLSVVMLAAIGAACVFDGLLLQVVPSLYGHEGEAITTLATGLLFAFGCTGLAALLAPSVRSARGG